MKANSKQAMEEMKRQREILRKRKEEEKAAKAKERQKRQAAMAAKCSNQTTGQRGGIAQTVCIDINTSTGGCSEAVVKQSSARQSKRSGSKDAPKTRCTSHSSVGDQY